MSEQDVDTAGEEVYVGGSTSTEKAVSQPPGTVNLSDAIKQINKGLETPVKEHTLGTLFELVTLQQAYIEKLTQDLKNIYDAHNRLIEHCNKLPTDQTFILAVAGQVADFLEAKINEADDVVEEKVSDSMIENILYDAICPAARDWTELTQVTYVLVGELKNTIGLTIRLWDDDKKTWDTVEKPAADKAAFYRACMKVMMKDNLPENVPYYFWYDKKPKHDVVPADAGGTTAVATKVSREENTDAVKFSFTLDDANEMLTYDAWATIDGKWEELEMSSDIAAQYRSIVEEAGGSEGEVWYVQMDLEEVG